MGVLWDPAKARANVAKHGVRFADAQGVLSDPAALTLKDTRAIREGRYVSVGGDYVGRILVVVYTHRGADIRLISARMATAAERRAYEEGV